MTGIERRLIILIAGAAAVAAVAGPVAAQSADISGAVTFEGGKAVPEGYLEIYLDDPASRGGELAAARTRTKSDGGSKAIAFSLSTPARAVASPTIEVVARLERADGWLVARGSAAFEPGAPVTVTLNTVMY